MAARLTAYIVALIVGVTFIAGLLVGAQRSDDGPVDVMVVNGRVYTADGEGTTAEALAIQGNKILRVGSTREIQRLRRPQTVVIDARGATVLPGFTQTGARLIESQNAIATREVMGPAPAPSRSEQLASLRKAVSDAHRRGITSVHTVGGSPDELNLYDELRRENALWLRVYGALTVAPESTAAQLDALDELRARFPDDPFLKAGIAEVAFEAGTVTTKLATLVTELDRRNWQIVLRPRGEGVLQLALQAFQQAVAANPAPPRGRRHRIEPSEVLGPIDFGPFEDLGILHLAAGEPTSILDVIDARTREAAWISFDDHRKGTLTRDMLADVVILSKDIMAGIDASIDESDVDVTIFDGKVVFRRGTASD